MNNFTTSVGHIIIATVIIVAATVLAVQHVITGGEALGIIGAIGGVSVGGAVALATPPTPSAPVGLTTTTTPTSTAQSL